MKKQPGPEGIDRALGWRGKTAAMLLYPTPLSSAARRNSHLYDPLFRWQLRQQFRPSMQAPCQRDRRRLFRGPRKKTFDRPGFRSDSGRSANQYSIGFVSDRPTAVSEFRKIQLTVKRPALVVQSARSLIGRDPSTAPRSRESFVPCDSKQFHNAPSGNYPERSSMIDLFSEDVRRNPWPA